MFYHASKTPDLTVLTPHLSNHGEPLVYLTIKRENSLVYLCNAVEKHCRNVGFKHSGGYRTWASYGFTKDGILRVDEYYPNATFETYKGEAGYIYAAEHVESYRNQADIPGAIVTGHDVKVAGCEYIADAYEEIMRVVGCGEIVLARYEGNSQATLDWIAKTVEDEYRSSEKNPEYRAFLRAKFGIYSCGW